MNKQTIVTRTRGPIGEIILNRPTKLNAITEAMTIELNHGLDRLEADDEVRVIVVRGEGRSFCAGFDLEEMNENPNAQDMRPVLRADLETIMRFWHSPKPTVSVVHGYALGGGFELAMACDATLASDDAIFGEPEPKFGSGIVALLLPWITGPKACKEMLLFGNDRIDAARALRLGLVNAVVSPDRLSDHVTEMALQCARLDHTAVTLTKRAINQSYVEMGMLRALDQALEVDVQIETTETEESKMFMSILKRDGAAAAIDWRKDRFTTTSTASQKG